MSASRRDDARLSDDPRLRVAVARGEHLEVVGELLEKARRERASRYPRTSLSTAAASEQIRRVVAATPDERDGRS